MRTLLKIVLGLAAAVLVLFLALVVAVTVIFDPDDYRPLLVDAVEEATGRSFELSGLSLSVVPCCAVSLSAARLGNPPGFPDDEFASIRSADLSLRIWPLLTRREVSIGAVTLDGVDANLVELADGRANWVFASDAPDAASQPPAAADASALPRFGIDALHLTDGRLRYRDAAGAAYTVSELELETGAINYGAATSGDFPLQASLMVTDDAGDSRARVNLAARVALPDEERLIVSDVAVSVDAVSVLIPGGEAALTASAGTLTVFPGAESAIHLDALNAEANAHGSRFTVTGAGRAAAGDIDLQGTFSLAPTSPRELLAALSRETVAATGEPAWQPADSSALTSLSARGQWALTGSAASLRDLHVRLDDSTLTGQAVLENFDHPALTVELAVDAVDIDRYLAADATAAAAPPAPAEPASIPLAALAEADVDGTIHVKALRVSGVDVSDLQAHLESRAGNVSLTAGGSLAGGRIELTGGGNVAAGDSRLIGSLDVASLSPRRLLTALGSAPDTADPQALTSFAGSTRWTLTPDAAALHDMAWQLDGTRITGSAGVDDFDALPARFDVSLDRINLDDYLPADHTAQDTQATAETEIPVAVIRGLNLAGQLRAGELVMMQMPLTDVVARVEAAGGVLRVNPLSASVFGGQYRGQVTVDATGPTAQLTLEQSLSAVQLSELLGSLFGSDALAGSLTLALTGSGAGNTPTQLLEGLAADVSFDLSDGVYRGADVVYELRRARALLRNESAPDAPERRETPIRTLKASGRMLEGVLQTTALTAQTPALRLLGEGGINLMALSLDYRLNAEVLQSAAAAANLGELANATIPLSLSGPLTSPKVSVDLKGLVTSTLRTTAEQRARGALMDRLGIGEPKGSPDPAPGAEPAPQQAAPADATPATKPSGRDLLKRSLRDLLQPPAEAAPADDD